MLQFGSRHHSYLELLGATSKLSRLLPAGITNGRVIEFMCDFMPTRFSTTQTNEALLGTYLGPAWFEYDAPTTNTAIVAPIRFGTIRNATDKYSGDGEIQLGKRTVVYGKDDMTNVSAWQDGVALGSATSQADWTPAEASQPFAAPAEWFFGHDDSASLYTNLRLYGAWVKVNGTLIMHYLPNDNDSATLPDQSPFANHGTVSGTEGTDFRYGEAWQKVASP